MKRRGIKRLILPGSIVAAILLVAIAAPLLPLPDPMPVYVSLAQRLKRSGSSWTAHDLRRTAATLMREAGVPVHDVEAVLNHAPPGEEPDRPTPEQMQRCCLYLEQYDSQFDLAAWGVPPTL